jgi:hypothetical protein
MELPSAFSGESLTRLSQGVVLGAIATATIGFGWGGWTLHSTATRQADDSARSAVVAVLAPMCADNFQRSADATAKLEEFNKVTSYKQASFVEDGGWAIFPGSDKPSAGVAKACATILSSLK